LGDGCCLPDSEFILRIGHSFRRTPELIHGEVDWLNFLAAGGASVARAVLSSRGELVEQIPDGLGEQFLATAFVKARGGPPEEAAWNTSLFEHWGQLLGLIHRLSKDYQVPNSSWRRPEWDDPVNEVVHFLPPGMRGIQETFQGVIDHMHGLPRDRESYGLIHQDAHGGNFFVDEIGNITLFDFDDCVYSWFIYDIAMVIFYSVMSDMEDRTPEFCVPFLRGYRSENSLVPTWLGEIPYFLKMREIELAAVIYRSYGENITDAWPARYMEGRMQRISDGTPYNPVDFTQFASEL